MQQQPVISMGIYLSSKDSKRLEIQLFCSCQCPANFLGGYKLGHDNFQIRRQSHILDIQESFRGQCIAAASVVSRDLLSALSGHGIASVVRW